MSDVEKKIYNNLRQCVRDNLIKPILGENYYNYGSDVYSCDRFITEDILYKYKHLKTNSKLKTILLIISLILNVIMIGSFVFVLATK